MDMMFLTDPSYVWISDKQEKEQILKPLHATGFMKYGERRNSDHLQTLAGLSPVSATYKLLYQGQMMTIFQKCTPLHLQNCQKGSPLI